MNFLSQAFDHPWLLVGLVGASLPIIIEWLFRRRRRRIVLPTLRFLLVREQEKKIRRQDRLLLILRCIVCALAALAVSRPVLRSANLRQSAMPHVVLVLDNTASMNQSVGVSTAFAQARKQAAEMLRQLPIGSDVSVVVVSNQADAVIENSRENLAAAAKVESLPAGEGAAPMDLGLAKAKEILEHASWPRGEVYVLSDFQKYSWLRDPRETSQTAQLLSELSAHERLYLVNCAEAAAYNDAVTKLAPADPILSAHLPMKFVAQIERFGHAPPGSHGVADFLVDGVKEASQPYNGTSRVEFTYRFPNPGEHLVSVELGNDPYTLDNERSYLASVPETHRVLILDPTAARQGMQRESFFLDRAIAPPVQSGFEAVSNFSTKVVTPAAAIFENFDDYDVVALLNCESVDESLAAKLATRVRGGGAALMFLGPNINPYEYNQRLFRDGKGALPCQVEAPVVQPRKLSLALSLAPLANLAQSGLTAANFEPALSGFVPLRLKRDDEVTTLGTLASANDPPAGGDAPAAIVEREIGRGRAIVVGLPPDLTWSSLPSSAEFALLTQDLLRELVATPDASVNLQVGGTYEQPVMVSSQPLLLQEPGGKHDRLVPEQTAEGWRVRYVPQRHGVYEVKTAPQIVRRRRFSVNVQTDESDLAAASADDLRTAFGSHWTYIGAGESWSDSVGRRYATTEIAPAVLWTLLAVLAAEIFLARRFGRRRHRPRVAQGGAA